MHGPPGGSARYCAAMKLSVLMPVYNEADTVSVALKRVLEVDYPCEVEVVLVDDGSADATASILQGIVDPRLRVVTHPVNQGKGAAISTAAREASGDYVIVCDADLEYSGRDPADAHADHQRRSRNCLRHPHLR